MHRSEQNTEQRDMSRQWLHTESIYGRFRHRLGRTDLVPANSRAAHFQTLGDERMEHDLRRYTGHSVWDG